MGGNLNDDISLALGLWINGGDVRLRWLVVAGSNGTPEPGVDVSKHPLSDVPVGGDLRPIWVHLAPAVLAREAEHVIELRDIATLQIIPQDHFVPEKVIYGEPKQFHKLSRVTCLLWAIEWDGFEELRTVYSILSVRNHTQLHRNPLTHEGVADRVWEKLWPPVVAYTDHLLDDHICLSPVLHVFPGRERREVQLALHVEAVHEGQELLGVSLELILPGVCLLQVLIDLLASAGVNVVDGHWWRVNPVVLRHDAIDEVA